MEIKYSNHPDDVRKYDTEKLRAHFLQEKVFASDQISLTYSHVDRIIFGGAMPVKQGLILQASKEMGVDYFLERREMGVINIGGKGTVILDGTEYELNKLDGMYIPMGIKDVKFYSADTSRPARFYINTVPAHKAYEIVKINIDKANPLHLGEQENLNVRTIYQYVHPDVCESCQLVMGMTALQANNVWNTMPCHTHERRMEVYFYFNLPEEAVVFHLMGEPEETRHLVMKNEQAVVSPSWSIHSGVGTSSYSFIWGMCGENKTFTDMDHIETNKLK